MNATERVKENVIEASGLTRYYRGQRGVRDLELGVRAGTITALLGENGCGKSTTLKLALGALVPDRGTIRTLGVDPAEMRPEVRARIGYVAERMDLPARMTLRDGMDLQAAYFPTWDERYAQELLKRMELKEGMVYRSLSHGQRRRAVLTLVLAQRPELLVLDEPGGGLDTAVRRQFLELLVEEASAREVTILLSSHILTDVERVVERVAFVKDGALAGSGELEEMKGRVKRLVARTDAAAAAVDGRFRVLRREAREGVVLAVVEDYEEGRLNGTGVEVTVEHLNLEEIYLVYTGGGKGEGR